MARFCGSPIVAGQRRCSARCRVAPMRNRYEQVGSRPAPARLLGRSTDGERPGGCSMHWPRIAGSEHLRQFERPAQALRGRGRFGRRRHAAPSRSIAPHGPSHDRRGASQPRPPALRGRSRRRASGICRQTCGPSPSSNSTRRRESSSNDLEIDGRADARRPPPRGCATDFSARGGVPHLRSSASASGPRPWLDCRDRLTQGELRLPGVHHGVVVDQAATRCITTRTRPMRWLSEAPILSLRPNSGIGRCGGVPDRGRRH